MKTIFHAADRRGHVSFGWLNSHHSFSFGHYHDPEKVHFGMLRVLNDDGNYRRLRLWGTSTR